MKRYLLLFTLFLISVEAFAQKPDTVKKTSSADSLFNSLNTVNNKQNVQVFESPRLILVQSTETVKKNNLNFILIHRFGDAAGNEGGGKTYYGLDDIADVYIGFQYGITNDFNIEVGRSTIPKAGGLADLQLKYAILHQTNDGSSPIAISLIGQSGVRPYNSFPTFSDRLSYFGEALFARKFSHSFSFEIAPSIVQNNQAIPYAPGVPDDVFSVSAAARLKVTNFMGIVVDYAHPFSSYRNNNVGFSDPLGFGIQEVTGGHVFTINVTNAKAVSEINYLSNTTSDYARGQWRIGFTISRNFDFSHKEVYHPKNEPLNN